MGLISCFSFYPGKNLGAYGEGGLVATADPALAAKLRMLRDFGQTKKYHHEIKGLNYRMDAIQGAVLDVKMHHIEQWTESRRRVAKLYQQALGNIAALGLPYERPECRHVWHIYAVRVDAARRSEIIAKLNDQGIGTNLHYPVPVHLQPCFTELGHTKGDFPAAEEHADRELSLPIFPEMTEAQVEVVAGALKRILV
jgi:dTDP-4-amino-4,6-dideoxygalactose transaminase